MLTDSNLAVLKSDLSALDITAFEDKISNYVSDVESAISQLSNIRRSVDQLSISVAEQVRFYTQLNGNLLKFSDSLAHYSPTGETANIGTGFATFVQSKERAGLERAVLSNAFSRQSFSQASFQRFNSLVNTQNIYLDVFKSIATKPMNDAIEEAQRDSSFQAVEDMRRAAIESYSTGVFDTDPELWFGTITQNIGQLKNVQDFLSKLVTDAAANEVAKVEKKRKSLVLLIITSLVLSTILGIIISRQILESVARARQVAVSIS